MIKIQVRGIEDVRAFLESLPLGMRRIAIEEVAKYLIGDELHGLKHLSKWKYVSRKSAYGKTFQTDKQRRWFWAQVREGIIQFPIRYQRTGKTADAWGYRVSQNGYQARLKNSTQGAKYVQGNQTQARQPAKVGHRKVSDVISTNIQGAMRAANQAVSRWIKEKRK